MIKEWLVQDILVIRVCRDDRYPVCIHLLFDFTRHPVGVKPRGAINNYNRAMFVEFRSLSCRRTSSRYFSSYPCSVVATLQS